MKRKLSLVFLLVFLLNFQGNAFSIDSLKLNSNRLKDTNKVDNYINIARYYYTVDFKADSLLRYAKLALHLAEKIKNDKRIMSTNRIIGIAYGELQQKENALKYYKKALSMAQKAKDQEEINKSYDNIATLYGKFNDFDKALEYFFISLKGNEKAKNYDGIANCISNINVIFYSQRQFDKNLEFQRKQLRLIPNLKKENNWNMVAAVYGNAAQYYVAIGLETKNQNLIDSSGIFAKKVLELVSKVQIPQPTTDAYYVLAVDANLKKEFKKSEEYSYKALQYKQFSREQSIQKVYQNLIDVQINSGNFAKAKAYLDTCYAYPSSQQVQIQNQLLEREVRIYDSLGDFKNAFKSQEKLMEIQQQLREGETNKTINELETKYQTEIKDAQISELNQQKKIDQLRLEKRRSQLLWLIGSFALVAMITFVIVRQRAVANRLKMMESEQRLNRARINPHFFFNALTSIQGLAEEEEYSEKVPNLLAKFSKIMRFSLESTFEDLVNLNAEKQFVEKLFDNSKNSLYRQI